MSTKKPVDPVGPAIAEATDKGYVGSTPDETPNEAYTVAGVTRGARTPEAETAPADTGKKD